MSEQDTPIQMEASSSNTIILDIRVVPEWSYAGRHHYYVMVNGMKYDEFTSRRFITHKQMIDIANGYKQGLERIGYGKDN